MLLVTNLRPGSHSALLDMLRTSVGPAALKTVLLDPEFNFGFVEFQEKEAMLAGLRYISGLEVGGATLSAERCAEITPGRNPLVLEELGPPTDTIVVKNLVFTASEAAFRDELKTATPHCEDPCDVRYRLNSQGQFMAWPLCSTQAWTQQSALARCSTEWTSWEERCASSTSAPSRAQASRSSGPHTSPLTQSAQSSTKRCSLSR